MPNTPYCLETSTRVIMTLYISLMLLFLDTFWTNPQYPVQVSELNKACEPIPNKGPNVLVSLMQKPDMRNRRLTRNLPLGFSIFKASENYQTSLFTIRLSTLNLCSHSSCFPLFQSSPEVRLQYLVMFLIMDNVTVCSTNPFP